MEKHIKDLRTHIDGLAQLIKGLKPQKIYKIDVAQIPTNWDIDKWIEYAETGRVIVDTNKGSQNIPIQELPQKYKELEKATDSLYLAKAWLGMCLQQLGTTNPYASGYKTKEDIEPTADRGPQHKQFNADYSTDEWGITHPFKLDPENKTKTIKWKDFNHIEKVDWLRTEIESCMIEVRFKIASEVPVTTSYSESFITNVNTYLTEAKFWLGFELQRIKESK